MTVDELIEELKDENPKAEIYRYDTYTEKLEKVTGIGIMMIDENGELVDDGIEVAVIQ